MDQDDFEVMNLIDEVFGDRQPAISMQPDEFDLNAILSQISSTDTLVIQLKEKDERIQSLQSRLKHVNSSATELKHAWTKDLQRLDLANAEIDKLKKELKNKEESIRLEERLCAQELENQELALSQMENKKWQNRFIDVAKEYLQVSVILKKRKACTTHIGHIVKQLKNTFDELDVNYSDCLSDEALEDLAQLIENKICDSDWSATEEELDVSVKEKSPLKIKTFSVEPMAISRQEISTQTTEKSPLKIKTLSVEPMAISRQEISTQTTELEMISIGTNFPDPLTINEILNLQICCLPKLLTPINELPKIDCGIQVNLLENVPKVMVNQKTMTDVKNIRRKIDYSDNQTDVGPSSIMQAIMAIKRIDFTNLMELIKICGDISTRWSYEQEVASGSQNIQIMKLLAQERDRFEKVLQITKMPEFSQYGLKTADICSKFEPLSNPASPAPSERFFNEPIANYSQSSSSQSVDMDDNEVSNISSRFIGILHPKPTEIPANEKCDGKSADNSKLESNKKATKRKHDPTNLEIMSAPKIRRTSVRLQNKTSEKQIQCRKEDENLDTASRKSPSTQKNSPSKETMQAVSSQTKPEELTAPDPSENLIDKETVNVTSVKETNTLYNLEANQSNLLASLPNTSKPVARTTEFDHNKVAEKLINIKGKRIARIAAPKATNPSLVIKPDVIAKNNKRTIAPLRRTRRISARLEEKSLQLKELFEENEVETNQNKLPYCSDTQQSVISSTSSESATSTTADYSLTSLDVSLSSLNEITVGDSIDNQDNLKVNQMNLLPSLQSTSKPVTKTMEVGQNDLPEISVNIKGKRIARINVTDPSRVKIQNIMAKNKKQTMRLEEKSLLLKELFDEDEVDTNLGDQHKLPHCSEPGSIDNQDKPSDFSESQTEKIENLQSNFDCSANSLESMEESSEMDDVDVYDSPMSPPPEDKICYNAVREYYHSPPLLSKISDRQFSDLNRERIQDNYSCSSSLTDLIIDVSTDDYDSPLSPPLDDAFGGFEVEIPSESLITETRKTSNLLLKIHGKVGKKSFSLGVEETETVMKYRFAIHQFVASEQWTEANQQKCLKRLSKLGNRPRYAAIAIVDVAIEAEDVTTDKYTPPCPAMPQSLARLVLLSRELTASTHFSGFERLVLLEIERHLFTFNQQNSGDVDMHLNLTNLYIGILDIQSFDKSPALMFIYKCLYYKDYLAIPMIYRMLLAYPSILPKTSIEATPNVLIQVVQCLLMDYNFMKQTTSNHSEYQRKALSQILRRYHGYEMSSPSSADVLENIVAEIKANRLRYVSYALILLGKRLGWQWAAKNILADRLMPLLDEFVLSNGHFNNDKKIEKILFVIGSTVKTFPEKDVSVYYHLFIGLIQDARSSQQVQEAAVRSLIQICRKGPPEDTYRAIKDWRQRLALQRDTVLMLKTFICKRPTKFWESVR